MKKLKKQRGFTLVEMLIVVAIIAILVAVSIPLFTNSLERAKRATDAANERAAKAAAASMILEISFNGGSGTLPASMNYDAAKGELVARTETPTSYGQCSAHAGGYIVVTFDGTNPNKPTYTLAWAGAVTDGTPHNGAVG